MGVVELYRKLYHVVFYRGFDLGDHAAQVGFVDAYDDGQANLHLFGISIGGRTFDAKALQISDFGQHFAFVYGSTYLVVDPGEYPWAVGYEVGHLEFVLQFFKAIFLNAHLQFRLADVRVFGLAVIAHLVFEFVLFQFSNFEGVFGTTDVFLGAATNFV